MIATIHPFPARMAPELALTALEEIVRGGTVVDPMMGSGTVIRHATQLGLHALGFDMDPLAVLMSRVWTTPVSDDLIHKIFSRVTKIALAVDPDEICLPWIDNDEETKDFIRYWFGPVQANALRCWSYAIVQLDAEASPEEKSALDVIRIALSRNIVTKEQCASLARDTSHSRPHRVALSSDYCVHLGMNRQLGIVRNRLMKAPPSLGAVVNSGDARNIQLPSACADAVLTSPPYLNAIDYLRGHRMSLVWLGYRIAELRCIRSNSIGAERRPEIGYLMQAEVKASIGNIENLPTRYRAMIERYISDILSFSSEIKRILKPRGVATLVVGNSTLKGIFVHNSAAVAKALEIHGLNLLSATVRPLPSNSRYLPTAAGSTLANRMREETILRFAA